MGSVRRRIRFVSTGLELIPCSPGASRRIRVLNDFVCEHRVTLMLLMLKGCGGEVSRMSNPSLIPPPRGETRPKWQRIRVGTRLAKTLKELEAPRYRPAGDRVPSRNPVAEKLERAFCPATRRAPRARIAPAVRSCRRSGRRRFPANGSAPETAPPP